MSDLDDKASQLARMLTRLQLTANAGQPLVILEQNVRNIRRMCDEVLRTAEHLPASTTVHMDPTLGSETANLFREYLDGPLDIPDHPPTDWDT